MGCLFCPIVAVVSTYFRSRRNLAMGIAISGLATGGIVFPLMVRELLPRLGFAWTMRCLGFVQLASLLIANAFTRTRVPPRRAGPLIEWNAFRDPVFTFFALGSFFNFWGVYFAFYYIGSYSRNIIGLSYPQSINLLMIINGIGAIGRIVPGLVADRWCGPLNVIKPATAVCTVMLYTWSTRITALFFDEVIFVALFCHVSQYMKVKFGGYYCRHRTTVGNAHIVAIRN
ncbi:major facilitator superfamily domain-containing protein [Exophiala viscosa]|uniref:Major facilitator superfamily domain-containing protein n=1 Tax=Exophiala viscosa TaxID=2486360 RepID=A0AAN6DVP6_9EURO|nr:major facilitator superfamily domain-containing protein [Exophiala viscosa]